MNFISSNINFIIFDLHSHMYEILTLLYLTSDQTCINTIFCPVKPSGKLTIDILELLKVAYGTRAFGSPTANARYYHNKK